MPAASASSAPTRATEPVSSCRRCADETKLALQQAIPEEASLANPVDLLGSATAATYEAVLPALLADPGNRRGDRTLRPACRRDRRRRRGHDLARREGCRQACAPGRDERRRRAAWRHLPIPNRRRARSGSPPGVRPGCAGPPAIASDLDRIDRTAASAIISDSLAATDDVWLEPRRGPCAAQLVRPAAGRGAVRGDARGGRGAAAEIGFPVVVKTAEAGAHKTESGGVQLDLRDGASVARRRAEIGAPVVVQAYVTEGAELLAGAIQDPVFGPLVAFGPGGVFAELIGSTRLALAPLTDVDAAELVASGKAGRLVAGWRGAPPADAPPWPTCCIGSLDWSSSTPRWPSST